MFVCITLYYVRRCCVIVGGIVADMGVLRRGAYITRVVHARIGGGGISNARTLCAAVVHPVRGGSHTCEPLTLPHCEDRDCTG